MKQSRFTWNKLLAIFILACVIQAIPAMAQQENEIQNADSQFSELEEKADQVIKVNLWGRSLDQAKKLLSLRKNITSPVKGFINGLTAVQRWTFRFRHNQAKKEDVEPVYQQLANDGWVPMIETEDRQKPESLSVYSYYEDEQVEGMTVISSEPHEVTVLKIFGPVDFDSLSAIGSGLGLPPIMRVATRELPESSTQPSEK